MKSRITILFTLVFFIAVFSLAKSKPSVWMQSQAAKDPQIISAVAPAIPLLADRARVSSNVIIELEINSSGKVLSAEVIEGHPLLRNATLKACLQWRFSSAEVARRTVRLTFIYPKPSLEGSLHIVVLPYGIELQANLEPPPETVSYIPVDYQAGKARCQVHRTALEIDKVKIVYGLVGFKAGYSEAARQLFPHSNKVYYGGCVLTDDSPKYAEVLYCRRCREAEAKWSIEHRKEKRYSTTGA
ncbi:MAG TPA: energy transducer TonB [Candidatus Saccharimonadales bacterium]|nr:energy transducer TonB [Candidatus Saccharimonadales bacterium]